MTSIIHGVVFWRLYERAFGLRNFSASEPQSYIAQMVGISLGLFDVCINAYWSCLMHVVYAWY